MATLRDDDQFGIGDLRGVVAAISEWDDLVVSAPDDEGGYGDAFELVAYGLVGESRVIPEQAFGGAVVRFELEGKVLTDEVFGDA